MYNKQHLTAHKKPRLSRVLGVIIGAAAILCTSQANALLSTQDVIDCVALNEPDSSFYQITDIEVQNNTGKQRKMQARVLGKKDRQNLLLNIRLLSPSNMAGTSVLVRERIKQADDIRLYLPALERTRYISDAMSGTKLFDTDFSYADFKQLYGIFAGGLTEYEGIETWQGRSVHKLRIYPAAENDLPYNAMLARVDTDTCVIMGMDFLDYEDEPQRQLEADPNSLLEVDGRHIAQRYTMSDLLTGSSTTLNIKRVEMDSKLPNSAFNPESFYETP